MGNAIFTGGGDRAITMETLLSTLALRDGADASDEVFFFSGLR